MMNPLIFLVLITFLIFLLVSAAALCLAEIGLLPDEVVRGLRAPFAKASNSSQEASQEIRIKAATRKAMERYARGNVLFQLGKSIDENELKKLSAEGTRALNKLLRQTVDA